MSKYRRFVGLVAVVGLALTACHPQQRSAKAAGRAQGADQTAVGNSVERLSKSQPIHSYTHSQIRSTLQDAEDIQANGVLSTTMAYTITGALVWWCPSIGAPVPDTYNLSGSKQWVDLPDDRTRQRFEVDQPEATGVYTGQSNGTWTICVDDNGKSVGKYSELQIDSTIGVVKGLPSDKRVVVDQVTFTFKTKH